MRGVTFGFGPVAVPPYETVRIPTRMGYGGTFKSHGLLWTGSDAGLLSTVLREVKVAGMLVPNLPKRMTVFAGPLHPDKGIADEFCNLPPFEMSARYGDEIEVVVQNRSPQRLMVSLSLVGEITA